MLEYDSPKNSKKRYAWLNRRDRIGTAVSREFKYDSEPWNVPGRMMDEAD
jgi:hypothetical protein